MKKRFIIKKSQLNEYFEKKNAEKIFSEIWNDIYKNTKYLKEGISIKKANQSVINSYNSEGKLTERVCKMLMERQIIDKNKQIL